MFTLELDMILNYAYHFGDVGQVYLTCEIQLPFAPYPGLRIQSEKLDPAPGPDGPELWEVKWDADRARFMADMGMICDDDPLDLVLIDLKIWIDLGWRFGSYKDWYIVKEATDGEPVDPDAQDVPIEPPPSDVPPVLLALIRNMVDRHYRPPIAYAMDQTHLYPTADEMENYNRDDRHRWPRAIRAFDAMTSQAQGSWTAKVKRSYPTLAELVARM